MERTTNSHRAAASQRENTVFSLYLESLFPILRSYLLQLYIGRSLPDLPLDLIKSGLYLPSFSTEDELQAHSTIQKSTNKLLDMWYFMELFFLIKPITE